MFKVEKNVPMPTSAGVRGAPTKYPFGSMAVGDSFFFPSEKDSKIVSKLSGAAFAYSKNHPECRFSVRWTNGGYRVWRIATTPKLVAAE